jgi:hypothetical protein
MLAGAQGGEALLDLLQLGETLLDHGDWRGHAAKASR